jgi:DNA-binding MarR family transcriptional regulator
MDNRTPTQPPRSRSPGQPSARKRRFLFIRYLLVVDEIAAAANRLRMVVRVLNRRAQAQTREGSPTRSQQAVLAWLDERGEMTSSALAAAEGVRPQSMGELVDTLEQRGWVGRRRDRADRRKVLVSLTSAGAEALGAGRELRQAWLTDALSTLLDAKERRQLIAAIGLLERVVSHPTEHYRQSIPPA